jgi:hypothetical protein
MAYSLTNETSIIFGDPHENTSYIDEHIIKRNDVGTWLKYRNAFWFIGKSSSRIYVKYPMETERVKLTHKLLDGKFNVYYNPKYENNIIIKREGKEIVVGCNLRLSDSKMFSNSDYSHILL